MNSSECYYTVIYTYDHVDPNIFGTALRSFLSLRDAINFQKYCNKNTELFCDKKFVVDDSKLYIFIVKTSKSFTKNDQVDYAFILQLMES